MRKKILSFLIFTILFTNEAIAGSYNIVATVNGTPISNYALERRTDFVIASSNVTDSAELRNKMRPQLLEAMISEILQKQEADKLAISVTDQDMNSAISDLEKKNGLEPGGFDDFVTKENVSKDELLRQLKTQILWRKVIGKKIAPRITVSDQEVIDEKNRIAAFKSKTEVYLSFIFLPFTKEGNEIETVTLADKLVEEIRKGSSFASVSAQFSQNNSGGDNVLGWLAEEKLDKEVIIALRKINPGEVTEPIRFNDGYRIFYLENRRSFAPKLEDSQVREQLFFQKLDLEARKYIRDLRNKSFVEINLQ